MNGQDVFATARLEAWPIPARPTEYEVASAEIEHALAQLPGIVAIYRTGSVGVPGISDLDHIAVVDAHDNVPSVWTALSQRTKYLAMHSPFLVDVETFRRHRWFAHLEPLALIVGEPLEIEPRPVSSYGDLLLGAESLVVNLMRTVKMAFTGRVKVRSGLCSLNTIRFGLTLAGLDESGAPTAWAVSREVQALRQGWFDDEPVARDDRLRSVLERSEPALREALKAAAIKAPDLGDSTASLDLRAPWSPITLVPDRSDGAFTQAGAFRSVAASSRRLAELRWRSGRRRGRALGIPAPILALLDGAAGPNVEDFRATRDDAVRQYADFMARTGGGYSAIGMAPGLLPR